MSTRGLKPAVASSRAISGAKRIVADLAPGDCLYIPSNWLHEVHSRTASFSLGWRVAMRVEGGFNLVDDRRVQSAR